MSASARWWGGEVTVSSYEEATRKERRCALWVLLLVAAGFGTLWAGGSCWPAIAAAWLLSYRGEALLRCKVDLDLERRRT